MTESKVVEYLLSNRGRMIDRHVQTAIEKKFNLYKCVVLLGPRQIGKSTLVKSQYLKGSEVVYCDLENEESLAEIGNGIKFFEKHEGKFIILDEVQENEKLFPAVKCIIDDQDFANAKRSKFLLLGSASLEIQRKSSASLLGRCSYIQMTGLLMSEVIEFLPSEFYLPDSKKDSPSDSPELRPEIYLELIDTLLIRGGLPASLFASSSSERREILQNIFDQYVWSNLKPYGLNVSSSILSECLRFIAKTNGQQFEIGRFTTNLGMNGTEVTDSIRALEQLLLVRKLEPLNGYGELGVDLSKHPKLYIRDSGLMTFLLGMEDIYKLKNSKFKGGAWEGFVIESIVSTAIYSGVFVNCRHFRTHKGDQELDLILSLNNGEKWGFEIKFSPNEQPSKGNIEAAETVQVDQRLLVHGGTETSELNGRFTGLPLIKALNMLRSLGEKGLKQ